MRHILTIASVLVGPLTAFAQAGPEATEDAIEFKFVYEPGQVVTHRVVNKAVGTMKLQDPIPEQKFSQTFEQDVVARCEQVKPDKSAVFGMTIPRIVMKMTLGSLKIDWAFDSRTGQEVKADLPSPDIAAAIFKGITQTKFRFTLGPDGQAVAVTGLDEGIEKVFGELKGDASPLVKPFMDKLREFMTDEMMTEQLESNRRTIPPTSPARIGDTWEHEWEVKIGFMNIALQCKGQYELIGIEELHGRPCAKIRITESVETAPRPDPGKRDPAASGGKPQTMIDRMRFEMTASGGDGIAYWDYQNGQLVRHRQTHRLMLTLSLPADPDAESILLRTGFGPIVQKFSVATSVDLIDPAEAGTDTSSAPPEPRSNNTQH